MTLQPYLTASLRTRFVLNTMSSTTSHLVLHSRPVAGPDVHVHREAIWCCRICQTQILSVSKTYVNSAWLPQLVLCSNSIHNTTDKNAVCHRGSV